MAQVSQLPCDGDGICMLCRANPSDMETITCKTCVTPWHVDCLSNPPETLACTLQWDCPDCSPPPKHASLPPPFNSSLPTLPSNDLIAAIRAIEADSSLTDGEKAKKRQELLTGKSRSDENDLKRKQGDDVLDLFDERLNCSFCIQLPDRPVTTGSFLCLFGCDCMTVGEIHLGETSVTLGFLILCMFEQIFVPSRDLKFTRVMLYVNRSHKEKRSSYAPEKGLRYDGIYRIEKCWRKVGIQGFKVCRYLFVRCDNDPAPWTSDEHGDRPRPLPSIPELKKATNITERKEGPSWDFDEKDSRWKWTKPPPTSMRPVETEDSSSGKRSRRKIRQSHDINVRERLLKEFSCLICWEVMNLPITTPCAHNFCKSCLEGAFAGKTFLRERSSGGRSLRSRKNVMTCPCCPMDISDFLQNLQVNRDLLDVIESLKGKLEEEGDESEKLCEEEIDREEENEGKDEVEKRKQAKVVVNDGEEKPVI